jgi:excisionase family DNA binding protein
VAESSGLPFVLTLAQVQAYLGISRATVYKMAHTPGFPVLRFGRAIRVHRDKLLAWIEAESQRERG